MATERTAIIAKTGVSAIIQSNRALPKKLLELFFAMFFLLTNLTFFTSIYSINRGLLRTGER
jgi:hypothetical protein